jgi:hypothetical protein
LMRTGPRVLAIRTSVDPILGWVAPLGLAAAAGTALVLDLDPSGITYPGQRTVASMLEDGPSRSELAPTRQGVAVVPSGGATPEEAGELVGHLSRGWPALVLRVGEGEHRPFVPVLPVLPGHLQAGTGQTAVWQLAEPWESAPGPGPVLPPLGRSAMRRLFRLELPQASRWVRAWRRVWELPWP